MIEYRLISLLTPVKSSWTTPLRTFNISYENYADATKNGYNIFYSFSKQISYISYLIEYIILNTTTTDVIFVLKKE